MHTFTCGSTRWHFNSDLSGMVRIGDENGFDVEIPGTAILLFMAQWKERQARIEIETLRDLNEVDQTQG